MGASIGDWKNWGQAIRYFQSETVATERRLSEQDFESTEVRQVRYVTYWYDCLTASLSDDSWEDWVTRNTIDAVAVTYQSNAGPTRIERVQTFAAWTRESIAAVDNGNGTSRVVETISRAYPWTVDPYVDFE